MCMQYVHAVCAHVDLGEALLRREGLLAPPQRRGAVARHGVAVLGQDVLELARHAVAAHAPANPVQARLEAQVSPRPVVPQYEYSEYLRHARGWYA